MSYLSSPSRNDFPETATYRPRRLSDLAWVELRQAILQGALKPGEPVFLKDQADRLGMSPMPVREAIQRLVHEGLVIRTPQRPAFVAPVSVNALEDLYSIRIALESLAVRRAATSMTEESHGRLTAILDAFSEAHRRGDQAAGREFHRAFHMNLYRLARSEWINRIVPSLLDHSERYRMLSLRYRGSIEDRRAEHQAILDACLRHDEEGAAHLLADHLRRTVELVKRGLEANGQPVEEDQNE